MDGLAWIPGDRLADDRFMFLPTGHWGAVGAVLMRVTELHGIRTWFPREGETDAALFARVRADVRLTGASSRFGGYVGFAALYWFPLEFLGECLPQIDSARRRYHERCRSRLSRANRDAH